MHKRACECVFDGVADCLRPHLDGGKLYDRPDSLRDHVERRSSSGGHQGQVTLIGLKVININQSINCILNRDFHKKSTLQ